MTKFISAVTSNGCNWTSSPSSCSDRKFVNASCKLSNSSTISVPCVRNIILFSRSCNQYQRMGRKGTWVIRETNTVWFGRNMYPLHSENIYTSIYYLKSIIQQSMRLTPHDIRLTVTNTSHKNHSIVIAICTVSRTLRLHTLTVFLFVGHLVEPCYILQCLVVGIGHFLIVNDRIPGASFKDQRDLCVT